MISQKSIEQYFNQTWMDDGSQRRIHPITFWCGSRLRNGSRNFISVMCLLTFSLISHGVMHGSWWKKGTKISVKLSLMFTCISKTDYCFSCVHFKLKSVMVDVHGLRYDLQLSGAILVFSPSSMLSTRLSLNWLLSRNKLLPSALLDGSSSSHSFPSSGHDW